MHRSTLILASLAVVAFGAVGCSGSSSPPDQNGSGSSGGGSGSGGGGDCAANANVSFKTDLAPIIQGSCSLTSVCHGTMNYDMAEDLYLGPNTDDAPNGFTSSDVTTAVGNLVGVKAKENPQMNMVTAGSSANSYLYHKIVGDMNSDSTVAAGCMMTDESCASCTSSQPCGVFMPYNGVSMLPADQVCLFKNWIDNGATAN